MASNRYTYDTHHLALATTAGVALGVVVAGLWPAWYQKRQHESKLEDNVPRPALLGKCDPKPATATVAEAATDKVDEACICEVCEKVVASSECQSMVPKPSSVSQRKRDGTLSWDDYFMALAFMSAERSKDPHKQVGACIVGESNVIISIGYNGFPRCIDDDGLPWAKASDSQDMLDTKYPFVVHAEANAILNTNTAKLAGQRIYVTMFPCNECAKLLIQAGLKEVIYCEGKEPPYRKPQDYVCYEASKRLFSLAGIKTRQYSLSRDIFISRRVN